MRKNIADEIITVSNSLEINPSGKVKKKLIDLLNDLINNDFQALIQLLYRIDINEEKIRKLLNKENNSDTASLIAFLIIERQLQKLESRRNYRSKNTGLSDEEKW